MSARYFQGTSVLGPVKASAARSFREVVDTMRICPKLGIKRAAFLALDKKERNEVKQVPFFVPACFKASPSKRVYEQATVCNLIFLDIDPETKRENGKQVETGHYPAKPFADNPESLYNALDRFNFAAHMTASSTAQKPRMRVVVEAEGIPLKLYARAVQTVGMMLGLTVTTESKVAVQPMFLPTLFSDSAEDENPLTAYQLDRHPFTISDISESTTELEFTDTRTKSDPALEALEYLRAPVPEITLGIAKEALSFIDPDCDFHEWTHIGFALCHQFSPRHDEDAFELFDEWSSEGSKYGGEDATRKKWKYLHQTSPGRVPITIRSLLREASAQGWDDKKVKETCFNGLVTWLETVATVTELMEQGTKKILATPLLSAVQEDVLVHMLCTQAKKRFAYTISATAIRKDLARTKAELKAQEKPVDRKKEPQWASTLIYCSSTQEFYRCYTGETYKPEAFNATYARKLLPTKDELEEAGSKISDSTLAKPIVSPSDYVLNYLQIPTVYDYAYEPSRPGELWFVERGRRYINKYTETHPDLDMQSQEIAGILFQKHLRNLIAEKEYREIITDFLAFMVQFPGRKIRWAILIQSVEGAGKTFLAEVMKAVLGVEHVKTISDVTIKTGYNEWAFGHQLVVLEEVRVNGANRHEIMNAMKPLITNDDVPINEKFRNTRTVKNISNYLGFSNYDDALPLTAGDRRWFVVKSPLQAKSQVLALGENYFLPLYKMIREMPGGLRSYFMDREISPDFRPDGHAPRTKYVQELINDTAGDLTAAIRRLIVEGDYSLIQYDILSAKTLMDALQLQEGITRASSQQVASVLRDEGYEQLGRHMIGTDRHYLWVRMGVSRKTAPEVATHRVNKNLKNLCMELIYGND